MVPPWVPDLPPVNPEPSPGEGDGDQDTGSDPNTAPDQRNPIAPAARFGGARRSMGDFARRGSHDDMRRGMGQYFSKGYGGGRTALRRFGGTVSSAGAFYDALSSLSPTAHERGQPGAVDRLALQGKTASEIIDAVIQAAAPVNGTQDTESNRAAMKEAMSEVLSEQEDADLMNLNDEQKHLMIERFVAIDVYNRLELDIGKAIQDAASSAAVALNRLEEIRAYTKQTVAAAFRSLRDAGKALTTALVREIVQTALSQSIEVFESYAE